LQYIDIAIYENFKSNHKGKYVQIGDDLRVGYLGQIFSFPLPSGRDLIGIFLTLINQNVIVL